MSILDALVVIIIAIFLTRGLWTGFIKQIASIAALILGFIIAGQYYGESASLVIPYIKSQQAGFFIAYILLFLVSFVFVHALGFLLKKVITFSMLGWFDKFLGALLGLAKGGLLSCLIFMGLALFISGSSPFFTKSMLFPYLEKSSQFITSIVKDEKLRQGLLPQKPAISEMFSNTVELGKKLGGNAK